MPLITLSAAAIAAVFKESITQIYLTVQSATLAMTNLVNAEQTEKTRISNEELARLDRELREYLLRLQHSHELQMLDLKTNYERTGIRFATGNFVKTVLPSARHDYPLIIFDTVLHNNKNESDENKLFNVMPSVYEAFQHSLVSNNPGVEAVSISMNFRDEAQILAFHNQELANYPSVIVYGSFDGTNVFIKASFSGMIDTQFDMQKGKIIIKKHETRTCRLFQLSYSTIDSLTSGQDLTKHEQNTARDLLQSLIDAMTASTLQLLIDSFFTITRMKYDPVTGTNIQDFKLMKHWFDEVKEPTDAVQAKDWTVYKSLWEKELDTIIKLLKTQRINLISKNNLWSSEREHGR